MMKRVTELYEIINNANEELAKIRSECKHETATLGLYEWAAGHTFPVYICDTCGAPTDKIITEEEYKNIMSNDTNAIKTTSYVTYDAAYTC